MNETERLEKFEKYISGKMKKQERIHFQETLDSDPDWQEFAKRYQVMKNALEYNLEKEFRVDLEQWSEDEIPAPAIKKYRGTTQRIYQMAAVAASIVILSMVGFWYHQRHFSDQALTAKYYQVPLSPISREATPNQTTNFQQGLDAFSKRDWQSAINYFSEVIPTATHYGEAQFFKGHAHFKMGDFTTSLSSFQTLDKLTSVRQEATDWMLLLCFMNTDDKELTMEQVQSIIENEVHGYRDAAISLNKDLQSIWRILN